MESKVELNLSTDTFPKRTLYGSNYDHLLHQVGEVTSSLRELDEKLRKAYPNARDYQTEDEWNKANAQHDEHVKVVRSLLNFYEEKQLHIYDELNSK